MVCTTVWHGDRPSLLFRCIYLHFFFVPIGTEIIVAAVRKLRFGTDLVADGKHRVSVGDERNHFCCGSYVCLHDYKGGGSFWEVLISRLLYLSGQQCRQRWCSLFDRGGCKWHRLAGSWERRPGRSRHRRSGERDDWQGTLWREF